MPNWFDARRLLHDKPDARYYFILGGRTRGKTFSVLDVGIEDNCGGLGMFAYIRRYDEEIKQKNIKELFSPQIDNILKYTNGEYNKITYFRGFFYFEFWGEDETGQYCRLKKRPEPCGVAMALNTWERTKGQDIGAAYGGFKHIILDEAITGLSYLSDEFQRLKQLISSLVRFRLQDTKIWLLANPLSMWCPYFAELGIKKEMIKDTPLTDKCYEIKYHGTDMTTIFIYLGAAPPDDSTPDTVYQTFFAFPNSTAKSKSITGGYWELQDSEHLPSQVYRNSTLRKEVFLYFGEEWIRGQIMRYDETGVYYLVWSPSRPPKKGEYYFILNAVPDRYAIVGTRTGHPYAKLLNDIIQTGQIYYSDNTVADIYHGFIKEANKIVR